MDKAFGKFKKQVTILEKRNIGQTLNFTTAVSKVSQSLTLKNSTEFSKIY